uniref:Uncharacterized protein n=1 Tax=Acanthochromis polyacanthus TaxID=80966 RepID=A0A3Q1EQL4_9TELE
TTGFLWTYIVTHNDYLCGGKVPESEVQIEVLYRPFLCHRKSKYGDILLVHHEGYFENGTLFHSRYVSRLTVCKTPTLK